jgi:hypothetical protein
MRPVLAIALLGLIVLAGCSSGRATVTRAHTTAAATRVSACIGELFRARVAPEQLRTPLPASILASFAIFRRAAVASDEPPASELSGGQLADQLRKEYAYARSEPVSADCSPRDVDRRQLAEQQRRRTREPVYCLIELPSDTTQGPGCEPFAAVDESARAFETSDYGGREATVELVPDGVASVRILYRDDPPIVVPVSANAFRFTPPASVPAGVRAKLDRLATEQANSHLTEAQMLSLTLQYDRVRRRTEPTRIEWLDGAGRPIRKLRRPSAASDAASSIGEVRAPIGG